MTSKVGLNETEYLDLVSRLRAERDTYVDAAQQEIERLQNIAGQSIREQSDLTTELLALRAAAQKVIDDPLLENASDSWRNLRDVLDSDNCQHV